MYSAPMLGRLRMASCPIVALSVRSGIIRVSALITAPFPGFDALELPRALVAMTVAQMLDPVSKLKGAAFKTEIGIMQLVARTMPLFKVLQFTMSLL
jgi:hypothetical protein